MAYYKCGTIHPTQNSNVVIDTASGSIANFETPLAMPLLDAQIDVNAVQDLHGQSGAYPAGGSAQKWDEEWLNGYLSSTDGSYISYANSICSKNFTEIQANTNYFLYKASSIPNTYVCWYDVDQLFISRELVNNSVVASPNNAKYFKVSSYGYGTTYNNNISINYPSTDTAYHPYSNICPINGCDEIKVVGCGKNLFDGVSVVYGYPFNGTIEGGNLMRVVFSRCKPNTTYTISKIQTQRFSVFWCEELPAVGVPYSGSTPDNLATSITVTTGATAKYICAFVYNQNIDTLTPEEILSSVQIEEGSQATTYEPYNGSTTLINLGGTYYGGYVSQDKDGKRELVVTHGYINLGSLNYMASSNRDATKYRKMSNTSIGMGTPLSSVPDMLCSIYKAQKGGMMYENNIEGITLSTAGSIVVYDERFNGSDDTTAFKEAMSGVMCSYPLAEPIIIDLPDGEPIKSFPGINNIFCDTGDTSVKFRKIGE